METVNRWTGLLEEWLGIATAAWFAPCLAAVATLEFIRQATPLASPCRTREAVDPEIPCGDHDLFA